MLEFWWIESQVIDPAAYPHLPRSPPQNHPPDPEVSVSVSVRPMMPLTSTNPSGVPPSSSEPSTMLLPLLSSLSSNPPFAEEQPVTHVEQRKHQLPYTHGAGLGCAP